jgi:hypothetical protein
MLSHLLKPIEPLTEAASSFVDVGAATPADIVRAKVDTAQWLQNLGIEDEGASDPALDGALATQAFGAATGAFHEKSREEQKKIALALKTPAAVQKTALMLTEYDWSFVAQAKELRGYIVKKLLDEVEETKKPEVRLKALKMLGEVTEVALFTQRTEIVTKTLSDEQIEDEINKRLEKLTYNPATPLVERVDNDVDD